MVFGILPYVKTTSLRLVAHLAKNAFSDMLRRRRSQSRSQRNVVRKDQLLYCRGVYTIGLCVSRFLSEKFSKGTWQQTQIGERKSPSRAIIQECEPHERSLCAPKFVERSHEETLHQERCARRVARNLAKHIYKLKHADKATFYTSVEARAMPAPTSKRPEEPEFAVDSGASTHMLSKKDLSSNELDTLRSSRTPLWWLRPMEKCKQTRKHKYPFSILIPS